MLMLVIYCFNYVETGFQRPKPEWVSVVSFLSWLRNENEQKRGLFILWRFILSLMVRKLLRKATRNIIEEAKASEELKSNDILQSTLSIILKCP
jgi:hypothetical protein